MLKNSNYSFADLCSPRALLALLTGFSSTEVNSGQVTADLANLSSAPLGTLHYFFADNSFCADNVFEQIGDWRHFAQSQANTNG